MLIQQVSKLIDARLDARDEALMQRLGGDGGGQQQIGGGGGGPGPRRMTETCTTGTASSNENVQKASLWLRGPDENNNGGRVVFGAVADVNLYRSDVDTLAGSLLDGGEQVGGVTLIASSVDVGAKEVQLLCDVLKNASASACGVLGAASEGKAVLAVFATKDLAGPRVHAGEIVKQIAGIVGGGGGGRPDFAQAGGKDPSRLEEAVTKGKDLLAAVLGG